MAWTGGSDRCSTHDSVTSHKRWIPLGCGELNLQDLCYVSWGLCGLGGVYFIFSRREGATWPLRGVQECLGTCHVTSTRTPESKASLQNTALWGDHCWRLWELKAVYHLCWEWVWVQPKQIAVQLIPLGNYATLNPLSYKLSCSLHKCSDIMFIMLVESSSLYLLSRCASTRSQLLLQPSHPSIPGWCLCGGAALKKDSWPFCGCVVTCDRFSGHFTRGLNIAHIGWLHLDVTRVNGSQTINNVQQTANKCKKRCARCSSRIILNAAFVKNNPWI